MRHKKIKKINKKNNHKVSMLRNMMISIMKSSYIRTSKKKGIFFKSFFLKNIKKIKDNIPFYFSKSLFRDKSFFKNFCLFRDKGKRILISTIEDGSRKGDLSNMVFIYFYFKDDNYKKN